MRIETDQRLVQQQKFRLAEQGLGQQQPLQLATGELRQPPTGEWLSLNPIERPRDFLRAAPPDQRQPPALAAPGAGDKIPAAQRQIGNGGALLRQISGDAIAASRWLAEDSNFAR